MAERPRTTSRKMYVRILNLKEAIFTQEIDKALKLIPQIDDYSWQNYREESMEGDNNDMTILHFAAAYTFYPMLLQAMVNRCPILLKVPRTGAYEGQTALHTLISKGNVQAVESVMDSVPEQWEALLTACSTGHQFEGTTMMGQLPLSIAALNFDNNMQTLLLEKYKAEINKTNSFGDTVFHSLIRYSYMYPDKVDEVLAVMEFLHNRLKEHRGSSRPRDVWLIKNRDGFTALKLAASLSQDKLFKFVLSLKGVYCHLDEQDGTFDHLLYDITEIDSAAPAYLAHKARDKTRPRSKRNRVGNLNRAPYGVADVRDTRGGCIPTWPKDKSVLDIVCETEDAREAFGILNNYVVSGVMQEKWLNYEKLFYAWWALYSAVIILLTTYAVFKSRVVRKHVQLAQNEDTTAPQRAETESAEETFVLVTSVVSVVFAVSLLAREFFTKVCRKQPLMWKLPTHNGIYRVLLVLLAVSLIADAFWYWVGGTKHYLLIFGLLVGWWFMAFFLRPFKTFSFFTVMLRKVLFGDMLRFCVIIVLELIAFSVAMFIAFAPSNQPPEEFRRFDKTLVTMFKLMLGLTEVEVLYEAPEPWVAVTLFVAFVLVTYTLMVNALIALMANTCFDVWKDKESHWMLQQLSVMLFLETSLPLPSMVRVAGDVRSSFFNGERLVTKNKALTRAGSSGGNKNKDLLAFRDLMLSRAFALSEGGRPADAERSEVDAGKYIPTFTPRNYDILSISFGNAVKSVMNGAESAKHDQEKEEKGRIVQATQPNTLGPVRRDVRNPIVALRFLEVYHINGPPDN